MQTIESFFIECDMYSFHMSSKYMPHFTYLGQIHNYPELIITGNILWTPYFQSISIQLSFLLTLSSNFESS